MPARTPIFIEVKDAVGAPVPTGSVNVKIRTTAVNATLYNAETGGSTITNPVAADSLGRVLCWVERGDYNAIISGTGITTYTVAIDATPTGDHEADMAWLPAQYTPAVLTNTGAGTTPVGPADGDRFVWAPALALVGPSEFRYRAASSSPYKWETMGGGGYGWNLGSANKASVAANVLTNLQTGWDDSITVAPFTAPFTGEYEYFVWACLNAAPASMYYAVGVSINGASLNNQPSSCQVGTAFYVAEVEQKGRVTVNAGDTIDARFTYSGTSPTTITRQAAGLHVAPTKVL